jgi:hypothetical protein
MNKNKIKKYLLALIITTGLLYLTVPMVAAAPYDRQWFLVQSPDKVLTVRDKIIVEAFKAGIDPTEAVEVARCESNLNPGAKNWSGSTARGLYQFIFGTWDANCKGDVYDEDANIACFMKLYPKHKGYWECAKLLGYTK